MTRTGLIEAISRYLAGLPPMVYDCHGCSAVVEEEDVEVIGRWVYCRLCADEVYALRDE